MVRFPYLGWTRNWEERYAKRQCGVGNLERVMGLEPTTLNLGSNPGIAGEILLMTGYDFERPFISQDAMQTYVLTDRIVAQRYGKTVKATPLSNIEYKIRFDRLRRENNMKPPPSCGRIFPGYLVVRKLNTPAQYETWMPDDVFEEIYQTILA